MSEPQECPICRRGPGHSFPRIRSSKTRTFDGWMSVTGPNPYQDYGDATAAYAASGGERVDSPSVHLSANPALVSVRIRRALYQHNLISGAFTVDPNARTIKGLASHLEARPCRCGQEV